MDDEQAEALEQWRVKKLIQSLEASRGNGTSMISLIIRPKDEVSKVNRMLVEEYGTAGNIKSRVNRQSVLGAISSAQQRLKRYTRTPPNGLVVYCGTVLQDDGREKKISIDFEPFKAVNTSLYMCDNKFHVEHLKELLESSDKYGFIIMDGNGCLYATLTGNTREILHRFTVELPKKHRRGGQSAVRFGRLRMEKRHNYVRKVAELASQLFISADVANVNGIILAGSAEFKNELTTTDMLDQRLQSKIVKILDISYGGETGFNQAIELSQDALSNLKLMKEKKVVGKFFEEVATDSGKYIFGVNETMAALEGGMAETLIIWEGLEVQRLSFRNPATDQLKTELIKGKEIGEAAYQKKDAEGNSLELVEQISLLDWIINNYQNFGAQVEIVTDCSQEGSQFVKGFGGCGAILRYKMDAADYEEYDDASADEDRFI